MRPHSIPRSIWRGLSCAMLTAVVLGVAATHLAGAQSQPAPRTARKAEPAPEPDFTLYQQLLDDYLSVKSQPGEPLVTTFDYELLFMQTERTQRMIQVRGQLLSVPPSAMRPVSRLAWAINTYNFLVLDAATENLYEPRRVRAKVGGVRTYVQRGRSSVTQMTPRGLPFFDAPVVVVEDQPYSLTSFQRHFVLADFDRAPGKSPPRGLDPRTHFAIVLGARGCAPLPPRAFLPESLDAQLDAVTRGALASPGQLRLNPVTGRLEASSIFLWCVADFGGPAGVFAFVSRYAPDSLRREIGARGKKQIDGTIPWDWKLNQTPLGNRPAVILKG